MSRSGSKILVSGRTMQRHRRGISQATR